MSRLTTGRSSAYLAAREDLVPSQPQSVTRKAVQHTLRHRTEMLGILYSSMLNIEQMASKHAVSQFIGKSTKEVEAHFWALAVTAYKQYLGMVKRGASLKEMKQFVRRFAKGPNRRAIKAEASRDPFIAFVQF